MKKEIMNTILQSFAQVLLKEQYSEYSILLSQFEKGDKRNFVLQHRTMFEKGWYDIEDCHEYLTEEDILKCFLIQTHKMYIIDWSGEEYSGQVKRSITMMLKHYGIERFEWNTKKFETTLDWNRMRRGDYLPLLFSAMDKKLNKDGFSIVFWENQSDSFCYTILPTTDFVQFDSIELANGSSFINAKTYHIYLSDKGDNLPKMMLYLKKLFSIPLNEIKEFCSKEKMLLATGNSITVKNYRKEIEKLGGKIEIEEIDR